MSILTFEKNNTFREYADGRINTVGVDYSGKITKVSQQGDYQLWHKSSGKCFLSRGQQCYVEPWYLLVKVVRENGRLIAMEIDGEIVNRSTSRGCKVRLLAKMKELAAEA